MIVTILILLLYCKNIFVGTWNVYEYYTIINYIIINIILFMYLMTFSNNVDCGSNAKAVPTASSISNTKKKDCL